MNVARWLPRFRQAEQALGMLASRETWSRSEIEAHQHEQINRLWEHARRHVPYYRRLAGSLPQRFAGLEEFQRLMPLLPKSVVRSNPRHFLSERAGGGCWTRTGGSTGTPMDVFWGQDGHRQMLHAQYRMLASWGIDIFARCAFLWGHADSLKSGWAGCKARWWQPVEDWLRNRIRLSAYKLGPDDLRRHLDRLTSFQPVTLYGYSQGLALLAQEAMRLGHSVPSLQLAILTSEPAYDRLVAAVQNGFGIPAVVEYGSIECGFVAGEGPDRRLRVREDRVFVETLPRQDGQYDLVLTILDNPSFPLIRYNIGDTTDAPLIYEPRGMAILTNVCGRDNDLIVSRSGRWIHGARLDALFKNQTESIRRFRVRQDETGALIAEVEPVPGRGDSLLPHLERLLKDLVEGYPVQVRLVDHLAVTPAGKHRLVVSALAPVGGLMPPASPCA